MAVGHLVSAVERSLAFVALFALSATLGTSTAHAQGATFDQQYLHATAQNPGDVRFELRLKDGQNRFYQDELIEIELLFSSPASKKYRLSTGGCGGMRPGRQESERYHFDPSAGVSDPLENYYTQFFGYGGSCFSSSSFLEGTPHAVPRSLNDEFRFDRPGRYRLFAVVNWISEAPTTTEEEAAGWRPLKTASNVIDFEILPASAAWEAQTLDRALQILDSGNDETERRRACKVLRTLASPAAVVELIKRLDAGDAPPTCSFDFMAGLFGSPHRQLVVQSLEQRLVAPDQPVSTTYLRTLAHLVFLEENPEPLPPHPGPNHPGLAAWNRIVQERQKKQADTFLRHRGRLLAAFPQKYGAARGLTVGTLLEFGLRGETLGRELAAVFFDLPPSVQHSWVAWRWREIANPAMVPVLQRIYENPPSEIHQFRDLALRRIYQLDPEQGRRLILAEICREQPRVGIEVLSLLPEETLPELDDLLTSHLEEPRKKGWGIAGIHSALLERYATPEVLPRVKALVATDPPMSPNEMGVPLLAYFLRAEPAYGALLVLRAATAPCGIAFCYRTLLTEVGRLHASPTLDAVAIALLDHEDRSVAADAARLLGENGSPAARKALWERFGRWCEQWKDREADLRYRSDGYPFPAEVELERALKEALTNAKSWVLAPEDLAVLRSFCVTRNCLQELESLKRNWPSVIPIERGDYDGRVWRVGNFMLNSRPALKDKLAQFPSGTKFLWRAGDLQEGENERLFFELRDLIETHGSSLTRPQ